MGLYDTFRKGSRPAVPRTPYPNWPMPGPTMTNPPPAGQGMSGYDWTPPAQFSPVQTPPVVNQGNLVTSLADMKRQALLATTAEQRRLAEEAAETKRQSLASQLENNRRAYAQQMGLMNEQSFAQGGQLLSGLADRGLATSGLQQLGNVQLQAQRGRGISQLADVNRQANQGALESGMAIESELMAQLNDAKLKEQSGLVGIDEDEELRQQSEADRLYNQIISASQIYGSETPEALQGILSAALQAQASGDTDALSRILSDPALQQAARPTDTTAQTLAGDYRIQEKVFGAGNTPSLKLSNGQSLDISKYAKTTGLGGLSITDPVGLNNEIKNRYKGFDYYDNITVDMARPDGTVRQKPFVVGTQRFATWNQAVAYIKKKEQEAQ